MTTYTEPPRVDASHDLERWIPCSLTRVTHFSKVHQPRYLVPRGPIVIGQLRLDVRPVVRKDGFPFRIEIALTR